MLLVRYCWDEKSIRTQVYRDSWYFQYKYSTSCNSYDFETVCLKLAYNYIKIEEKRGLLYLAWVVGGY